eukprot:gene18558-25067_t
MSSELSPAFQQLCSLSPKFGKACEDRLAPLVETAYFVAGAIYGCILAVLAILKQILGIKDTVTQLACSVWLEAKPVPASVNPAAADPAHPVETPPNMSPFKPRGTSIREEDGTMSPKSSGLQTWDSSSSNFESCNSRSYASSEVSIGNDVNPLQAALSKEGKKQKKPKKSKKGSKVTSLASSGLSSPGNAPPTITEDTMV